MRQLPSEKNLNAVDRLIISYMQKSGTCVHPDPTPDKGRPLKHRADAREDERHSRPS